jgi:hypothetical protein
VNVDPLLRRIEATAVVVCVAMAVAALAIARERAMASALAVLAGGVLAGVSYRLIVAGAEAIVQMLVPASTAERDARSRPSLAVTVLKLAGRYALLALLAYVMIARLRLPPLGLLAGASSVVAAVSIEAVRFLAKKTP